MKNVKQKMLITVYLTRSLCSKILIEQWNLGSKLISLDIQVVEVDLATGQFGL